MVNIYTEFHLFSFINKIVIPLKSYHDFMYYKKAKREQEVVNTGIT